jgi:hypothetical protein
VIWACRVTQLLTTVANDVIEAERCGKINASNSVAESWTGIGVVAGCGVGMLIRRWPHWQCGDLPWEIILL